MVMGRELSLTRALAKTLRDSLAYPTEVTKLYDIPGGCMFEVLMFDPDGQSTDRVARVTVEYDRMEPSQP